jgi:hypothetical protein
MVMIRQLYHPEVSGRFQARDKIVTSVLSLITDKPDNVGQGNSGCMMPFESKIC